jgi:hypothetical protein
MKPWKSFKIVAGVWLMASAYRTHGWEEGLRMLLGAILLFLVLGEKKRNE